MKGQLSLAGTPATFISTRPVTVWAAAIAASTSARSGAIFTMAFQVACRQAANRASESAMADNQLSLVSARGGPPLRRRAKEANRS